MAITALTAGTVGAERSLCNEEDASGGSLMTYDAGSDGVQRQHLFWSTKLLAGTMLLGFGIFNTVEGIVDHHWWAYFM